MKVAVLIISALLSFLPLNLIDYSSNVKILVHSSEHFVWYVDLPSLLYLVSNGIELEKYYDYPEEVLDLLVKNFGCHERFNDTQNTEKLSVFVRLSNYAYATSNEVSVPVDSFRNEYCDYNNGWFYVLLTHEMVNMYTARTVSPGWPVDWWADHKSPYPLVTACLIMNQTDIAKLSKISECHLSNNLNKPFVKMFFSIYKNFGSEFFKKMFDLMRNDSIELDYIGENPSLLRTEYVFVYMLLSNESVAKILDQYHPGFNQSVLNETKKIILARNFVFNGHEEFLYDYLSGNYEYVASLAPS